MPPRVVYLLRHGQAYHNVQLDLSLPDPYLTSQGENECKAVKLPHPLPSSSLIVASPLKRTIQTAQLAFSAELSSGDFKLQLMPELQECSDHPCDRGSAVEEMKTLFPDLDWSVVPDDWNSKEGKWHPAPTALRWRAKWVKTWLSTLPTEVEEVVLVSHGGFLRYLAEPRFGHRDFIPFDNAEVRSYTLSKEEDGEPWLVEIHLDAAAAEATNPPAASL